jgi:hypothetical protein
MVTRLLRERGEADDEPLAAVIVAALKGIGFRATVARRAPDWRTASGSQSSGARPSDAAREWVLDRSREAAERQEAEAKARVKARATGHDPDDGRWPAGWLPPAGDDQDGDR